MHLFLRVTVLTMWRLARILAAPFALWMFTFWPWRSGLQFGQRFGAYRGNRYFAIDVRFNIRQ